MQDDRFTCMEGFIINLGRSDGVDKGVVVYNGAGGPGRSSGCSSWVLEDGFSRMEVWGGMGFACTGVSGGQVSEVFSCILESDSGEGVVRSNVDAAQSQWADRAP